MAKRTWFWVLPRVLMSQRVVTVHRETCGSWRSSMIPVSPANVAKQWRRCARCKP